MKIEQKLITKHFDDANTKKKGVVFHWSVTRTVKGIYDTFMGTRRASAHYGIQDETIWQFVKDEDIAWHAKSANLNYIGIECCGGYEEVYGSGNRVPPTKETHDTAAQLLRYVADKYNWGELVLNKNVFEHNDFVATACPGTLDVNYIIKLANMATREQRLKEAKDWNDLIAHKNLIGDGQPLVRTIENQLHEDFLIRKYEETLWYQASPLKNTMMLDEDNARYSIYLKNSTSV